MSGGKDSGAAAVAVAAGAQPSGGPLASTERLTHHQRDQLQRLLITTVAGCTLMALVMVVSARLLIGQFASIERTDAEQKAAQIYHAAETDVHQLAGVNRNNAEWDDAVEFVTSRDRAFVNSNFNATTLSDLRFDFSAVLDPQGQPLFSALYDRASHELISPAPAGLLNELLSILAASKSPESLASGELVRTSRGLMALSSIQIKRSDRSAATGAYMVAGRELGAAEVARFAETSQLPVSLVPLSDAALPDGTASSPGTSTFARVQDDATIRGYAVLRDFTGVPVALLRTEVPRGVFHLGLRTTLWLMGGGAVILLLFSGLVIGLVLKLRRTLGQYEEAQARLQRLAAQLREIVLLVRASDLRIVDANDAAVSALGTSLKELTTRRLDDLYPDIIIEQLLHTLQEESAMRLESTSLVTPQRQRILTDSTVTWLDNTSREYLCVVSSDVSHRERVEDLRKEKERQLARLAHYDTLTGLPNRQRLIALLGKTLRQTKTAAKQVNALYYLNIDDLKSVNESYGLALGDQVLRILAKRLRAGLDAQCLLARVGGDEFVVVVPMLPDMAAVDDLASRMQTLLEAPVLIEDLTVAVSACIGMALFPDHGVNAETLLRHANMAMYAAKQAGPRQTRLFSVEMSIEAKERADMVKCLREALGRQEMRLDYEPVFDVPSGRVAYLDGAPVWEQAEFGALDRVALFEAAEKAHLLPELGRELVRLAVADLRRWKELGLHVVPTILGVAPAQLDGALPDAAARQAAEAAVECRLLCFAVASDALKPEAEHLRHAIERLRSAGFAVLGDCVAPRLPSPEIPLDGIRLAPVLIEQLSESPDRSASVRRLLQEAQASARRVTAQGVSSAQQMAVLTELGCQGAQGPFLSPVQSAHACQSLLAGTAEGPGSRRDAVRSVG
jgi:diguanylate cyclase (GGDEF)-like protein